MPLLGMMGHRRPDPPGPPRSGIVTDRKKPGWTEVDVLNLPAGEHDDFERKAGAAVGAGGFYEILGPALSSFANSMGGHLILGVRNDGTFDGVDRMRGQTPTREWLEQIIPARCTPPIPDFRVHEVVPSSPSTIPEGRVVLVVDVSESRSNHQATSPQGVYYHRSGGRSVPASHDYLETRRARLTQPILVGQIVAVRLFLAYPHESGLFIELKIQAHITNIGEVAATGWQFVTEMIVGVNGERLADYVSVPDFPKRGRSSGIPIGERTIYPRGVPGTHEVDLGLRMRPEPVDAQSIRTELDALFRPETALRFHVASLTDGGATVDGPLEPVLDRDALVAQILDQLNRKT
jgi:hypothetical protein